MSAVMTYASLLTDVQGYAERGDAAFTSQIPRFVMLAEASVAAEARGLGQIVSVQDTMTTGAPGSAIQKPTGWRETASLQIGTGAGNQKRVTLRQRPYEYCRMYWPDATQTAQPKYYAEYDWNHLLISPSPDAAYPYELLFHQKPAALDSTNQTNWTTANAPQLILFATLLEAQSWIKRADRVQEFQTKYDRALKQVEFQAKRMLADRSAAVENPNA